MRLPLIKLHPREFLILLVLQGEILTEPVDELAMGTVVVLSSDVALNEHVYLYRRVNRKGKKSFPLVVVQTVFPVDAVLGPHLPERLQTDPLLAPCERFSQFVENLLIEDLSADLEEWHQLCKF